MAKQQTVPSSFNANPPASGAEIALAESLAGLAFPEAYKAFLARSNGGEGFVGEYYVILWRAGDLARSNQGYEAPIYAPELFLIGSDGGGEAIAFDRRHARLPIVQVPFIGLELEYADVLAARFDTFFTDLAAWRDDD